jgi:hypothetical protein
MLTSMFFAKEQMVRTMNGFCLVCTCEIDEYVFIVPIDSPMAMTSQQAQYSINVIDT